MPVNDAAYAVYNWQRPSNFHYITYYISVKLAVKTSETEALCLDMILISLTTPVTNFPSFGADLEGDLVIKLSFCSRFEHKVSRFGQYFEVDVQARFRS